MTIAEYLAELERRLPGLRRRRVLAEVDAHLRDAAARYEQEGLRRDAAELAATRDFGEVSAVARLFASETARHETRIASFLVLVTVALFVVPLYLVPENTLPPARWADKPEDIAALQLLGVALWLVAGSAAALSSLLSWTRAARSSAGLLDVALLALAGSLVAIVALVLRWVTVSPVGVLWPLLGAPLALACLVACAYATGWAHSRRCRLVRD